MAWPEDRELEKQIDNLYPNCGLELRDAHVRMIRYCQKLETQIDQLTDQILFLKRRQRDGQKETPRLA